MRLDKFIATHSEASRSLAKVAILSGQAKVNGVVVKKQGFKVKSEDEELLPHVHRVASLLKRWLIGTHQNYIGVENLKYYLDEYTFRYNRRTSKSRGLLFYRLIEQAVVHAPVIYDDIIYSSDI